MPPHGEPPMIHLSEECMFRFRWIRQLFSAPHRERKYRRRRTRPMLEQLEDRLTPSTTWTVNVTTDNGGAGGQGNGNSGDLRYCVTQAAPGDTVVFAAGLNNETINLNSQIQVRQTVTLTTQNDPKNPVNVTISGQNKTRLFWVLGGSSLTLTGLNITGGDGTDGQGNAGNGGAILVNSLGFLFLNNDTFNNNATTGAGTNGGAIENDGVASVYGCTFEANNSVNSGGAIENTNNLLVDASSDGTSSSFSSNVAVLNGGAIDSSGGGAGPLAVNNSVFSSNKARKGGAINTNDSTTLSGDTFGQQGANISTGEGGAALYASASVNASFCLFANNQALASGNGSGGAIYTSANLDVEQSTFTGNSAANYGGAIDANWVNQNNPPTFGAGTLTLNLDTFTNNTANYGGGVAISDVTNSGRDQVYVTNDTFYQNHVNSANPANKAIGGGLYLQEATAGSGSHVTATLTNDTFFQNTSDNRGGGLGLILNDSTGSSNATALLTSLTVNQNTAATDSGGMYVDSALGQVVSVDNTILSGNNVTAPGYNGPVDVTMTNNNAALGTEQYNLVGTSDTMFKQVNKDRFTDTPGLAAFLAANGAQGGYPQTLALTKASLGFRTGDPGLAGQSDARGVDERGYTRPAGQVSIGAEDPGGVLIQQGQTSTAVVSSVNPSLPGQPVTFTATVTADGGIPTGTVTFEDGDTVLGTSTLDADGNATYTTSTLALGVHTITADYGGDGTFTASNGSLTQIVSQEMGNTFVDLSSSLNPAAPGQAVTFTANVSGDSGTPTGTVTFLADNDVLGTATLDGNDNAAFTTSTLPLGSHTITALYNGDGTYSSNSASMTQVIALVGSTTYLTSDGSPQPGDPVTFTANVFVNNGDIPTGTVTFLNGTAILGTAPLTVVNGQGQATFTTSFGTGNYAITAVYSGDHEFLGSSGSMVQSVGDPTTSVTSLLLGSSSFPSLPGQEVTFTAALNWSGPTTPTGTVTFLDGTTVIATAPVDATGNAT
ncbi:MAG TPA: Ig-like domain repeat protein, partial [Gemmataceae bacterium]